MSTWFGIAAEFTLKPDVETGTAPADVCRRKDRTALAAAMAAYNTITLPTATRLLDEDTLLVETEGEMSHETTERLRAGLADLVERFGDGQPVKVRVVAEHDYEVRSCSYWLGSKASVLTELAQELAWRRETLDAEYDRQIARLADLADEAFCATEGW